MVVMLSMTTISIVYKDDISIMLDKYKYGNIEFLRRCKDVNGLRTSLEDIKKDNNFIKSYNIYLYQPKDKAVYKELILYNELNVQGEVYLKDQRELSKALANNEYLIYSSDETSELTNTIKLMNAKYLMIYKLEANKKIYGEVYLSMDKYPLSKDREKVLTKLRSILFKYII